MNNHIDYPMIPSLIQWYPVISNNDHIESLRQVPKKSICNSISLKLKTPVTSFLGALEAALKLEHQGQARSWTFGGMSKAGSLSFHRASQ